ncbi:MFS transporter [Actinoplanes sp. HUAS TT8]|uniref:MFS transporter n=1 Tax=Actinoplanes sp. HUAS TT8 TaxID=3447453 RepID=UPI003F521058
MAHRAAAGPHQPAPGDIVGDICTAALLAALAVAPGAPLWLVATAMTAAGIADGPAVAAKRLLLPFATADAEQPLERGASLATGVERACSTFGPLAAGWLLTCVGGARALWVAAALLATAAALAQVVTVDPIRRLSSQRGYGRNLVAGAAVLFRSRSLASLTGYFVVTNLLDQALLTVLVIEWARQGGHGPALLGATVAAAGAAATLSALTAAWLGRRLPARATYLLGVLVSGPTRFLALALPIPTDLVVALWALAGAGSGLFNPVVEVIQIRLIPLAASGRTRTLIDSLAWAGIPVGGAAGGLLLQHYSLGQALWICAVVYSLAAVSLAWLVDWSHPALRSREPSSSARLPRQRTTGSDRFLVPAVPARADGICPSR